MGATIEVPAASPRVSANPPLVGIEPFKVSFGPGRITGSFDLTTQEDADKMIEILNAMKAFLKMKEAAN